MPLSITNNNGIYEVKGTLNSKTTAFFKKHFESLLTISNYLTISLNKVKDVDKSSVREIGKLCKKALNENKIMYFIGEENKEVCKKFKSQNLGYLIRHDNLD